MGFNPNATGTYPSTVDSQAFYKISQFPKTFILALDTIDNGTDIEHIGGGISPSWNCLFIDGHVTNIANNTIYQELLQNGGTAWGYFENIRYSLETVAAGGSLQYIMNNNGTALTYYWKHSKTGDGASAPAGYPAH